uniref:XPG N-terminal domain-containing protein n=1 Tax=Aureoumbra lagunensis TaxID=44058 RepID=A0A7S3NIM5_9STRA|mmetsp:Transcript_1722/g.2630  ORF Transcript_1722/g.2630 Transcript_1722/m.2630 type:complete len:604 (+) Transcript_1722:28-1839(+)
MGIKGLHSQIRVCSEEVELWRLRGLRLAVDATGWLFRGATGAAGDGEDVTEAACRYVVERVRVLARYGATCYLVFDGGENPIKQETATLRQANRDESLQRAVAAEAALLEYDKENSDDEEEMRLQNERRRGYIGAVKLNFRMIELVVYHVNELKKNIHGDITYIKNAEEAQCLLTTECVVAPYEADGQMIALCATGHTDVVVTEDSDAYAYLAACEMGNILLVNKLDTRAGYCRLFQFGLGPRSGCSNLRSGSFFAALRALGDFQYDGTVGNKFLQICLLAGCDYVEAVCGIVSAATRVAEHRFVQDHEERWRRLLFKFSSKLSTLPTNNCHKKAELAFYHARVFNLHSKTCVPLFSLVPNAASPKLLPDIDIESLLGPFPEYSQRQITHSPIFRQPQTQRQDSDTFTPQRSIDDDGIFKNTIGPPTTRLPSCSPDEAQILTQPYSESHLPDNHTYSGKSTSTKYEINPDDICLDTLAQLPHDIRFDIQRQMTLARRSVRALQTVNTRSSSSASTRSSSTSNLSKSQRRVSSSANTHSTKNKRRKASLLPPTRNLFHFFSSRTSPASSSITSIYQSNCITTSASESSKKTIEELPVQVKKEDL